MSSITNLDQLNEDLSKPHKIMQQLETMQDQLPSILDDFKKYYVFYNKTPDYPEYQQSFENIKNNLNKSNSKLFTLSNEVDSGIDKINQKLFELNELIKKEKERNLELKRKLGMVEQKGDSSDELIHDYKTMYNMAYIRNWSTLASIATGCVVIYKFFSVKSAN